MKTQLFLFFVFFFFFPLSYSLLRFICTSDFCNSGHLCLRCDCLCVRMSMSSTTLTLGTSSLAFFLLGFLLWQLADCGVGCRQTPWDVDLNELYATVLPPNPSPSTLNCACGFKRIWEVWGGIASKMLSAEFQNLHPSRARPSPTLHYLLYDPPYVFCCPSEPPHGPTDQFLEL